VERAAAVLEHLRQAGNPADRTVTGVARMLGLHKSSCSNILRTLEVAGFVEYESNTKSYILGPELIGLGAAATRQRDVVQIGTRHLELLVRSTGFTCCMFTQLPNRNFLIVAKIDSPKEIKITVDVGQHFPPGAPAMARLAMAWMAQSDLEAYLASVGTAHYTAATKVDYAEVLSEVRATRERGYAVSRGEYYPGNTAISAPVFSPRDNVCRGICLLGFTSEISERDIAVFGEKVRESAQAITQAIGGRAAAPAPAGANGSSHENGSNALTAAASGWGVPR
jgi:DNA-binding IclR family transcriptional regulator